MAGWLIGKFGEWPAGWLYVCVVGWLQGWLAEWLIGWLAGGCCLKLWRDWMVLAIFMVLVPIVNFCWSLVVFNDVWWFPVLIHGGCPCFRGAQNRPRLLAGGWVGFNANPILVTVGLGCRF